ARERDGVAGEGRGLLEAEGAGLAVVGDARVAPPVSVRDAGRTVAPRDEPGAEAGRSVVLRSAREPGADGSAASRDAWARNATGVDGVGTPPWGGLRPGMVVGA
ncbi:hypothetical protein ACLESO_59020, partial [Pyxidicoccus sp. 3LG]